MQGLNRAASRVLVALVAVWPVAAIAIHVPLSRHNKGIGAEGLHWSSPSLHQAIAGSRRVKCLENAREHDRSHRACDCEFSFSFVRPHLASFRTSSTQRRVPSYARIRHLHHVASSTRSPQILTTAKRAREVTSDSLFLSQALILHNEPARPPAVFSPTRAAREGSGLRAPGTAVRCQVTAKSTFAAQSENSAHQKEARES